jgi:hypothetical protein
MPINGTISFTMAMAGDGVGMALKTVYLQNSVSRLIEKSGNLQCGMSK